MKTTMKKLGLSASVCVGILLLGAAGATRAQAQNDKQPDVAAAMEAVAEARDLAVEWAKLSRYDDYETAEAVAASIRSTLIKDTKIFKTLKSIKLVPLPDEERTEKNETSRLRPTRAVVRVLYSDGSVKYYDGGALDGTVEMENAPSEATIKATREYCRGNIGEWYETSRGLPPTKTDAQTLDSLSDVDKAKAQVAISRRLTVIWIRWAEDVLIGNQLDKSSLPPLEALASAFVETKEKFDFVNAAVKSIKIVPLPATEEGAAERGVVRVLFSDGSVKYFDDRLLAGQAEPLTTPSEAAVDAAPEYVVDLDAFYDEHVKRARAAFVEKAVARHIALNGGDGSNFSATSGYKPLKPSVVPVPKATNEARFVRIVCQNAAENAKRLEFDAETTATYIAANINFKRAEILKTVGIYSAGALTEIKSVKVVPFVVMKTLEAEKIARPTVAYVVRVAYSDGVVKYYDDGTYGEPLKYGQGEYFTDDGISGGEVDLSKIPNYVPLVANEEELPEFDYELNGFDKLAGKREAEAKERQEKIARFLQAQIDAEKNVVPAPAASAE